MAKAYVGQPGQRIAARDSNDVALANITATGTDFNTAAVAPKGANRIGFFIDVDSSTGTSPTLDVTFDVSFDGGTTWADLAKINLTTSEAVAQIGTTTGGYYHSFDFCGDPEFARLRANFAFGGSTPIYDFGNCYWVFDYVAKG